MGLRNQPVDLMGENRTCGPLGHRLRAFANTNLPQRNTRVGTRCPGVHLNIETMALAA
jgi:hypothetical protein